MDLHLGFCAICKDQKQQIVLSLHGDQGGPSVCPVCSGKWHAEHARKRKAGRVVIRAIKAFEEAGGSWKDVDKLKISSMGGTLGGFWLDPLGYMADAINTDGEITDLNRNRHGRLRFYFRRPSKKSEPRVRLPDSFGSPEFEAAWRAAMAGQPIPLANSHTKARSTSRGKLGWLIKLYLQSPEFQALKPATKRPRVSMLEKLAADKGAVDLEDIDTAAIQASVDARRDTPCMANAWLTTVSNVFAWATRECLTDPLTGEAKPILDKNPCEGVKRLPIPKPADPDEETGHPEFSDEDLATFARAYPLGTRERLVFSVLLYTGLRVATRRVSAANTFKRTARSKSRPRRPAARPTVTSCPRSSARSMPDRTGNQKF